MRADILDTRVASYDEVMAINLRGPFFLTQRVANDMIRLIEGWRNRAPQNRQHRLNQRLHQFDLPAPNTA